MAVVAGAIAAVSGWVAGPGLGAVVGRLLISTAVSAISSAVQKQISKPSPPGIKTDYTTDGGTRPMSFVMGWYATDGHHVCPPMSHGRVGRASKGYLTYVIALADVPGMQIDKVIIDDTEVEFEAAPQAILQGGDVPTDRPAWWYEQQGINPSAPNTPTPERPQITPGQPVMGDKYRGKIWLRYHDGSQTAADPYLMQVYGPGTAWASSSERPWTADMVGVGTCYAALTFKHDTRAFNGLPRVRFVMAGIPLYDPRKDSSAGGTGPQRWADRTTWTRSTNGMVLAYNVLRGIPIEGGPLWGYGVAPAGLPLTAWAPVLTAADQVVDGKPRWQASWEVSVDEQPAAVLDEILKVCCAEVAESGGVWKPRIGPDGPPVYVLTDDDLILDKDASAAPFPGLESTYNGVHANYPEPKALWRPKDAPPRYNAGWEAADQGRRLVAELNLPACPWDGQIQRVMRAYIEEERRFRRHVVTLPPEAEALEVFDVISWTSAEHGYDAKLFRVVEVGEDPETLLITVSLREVDPADYDWRPDFRLPSTVPSVVRPRPAPIVAQYFTAEGIALRDAAGRARRTAARLRWGGWALDGVTGLEWELRRVGQVEVARGMVGDPESGETVIDVGTIPLTDYEARIRFVAVGDRDVAWTLWVAFRTPDVRLLKDDLDVEVLADVDVLSDWMDDTGPFLRDLRGEIADLRDSIAEVDWGNYTIHNRVRREATAEVAAARAEFVEEINVAASATEAVATRVTALTATVGQNTAAITQEQLARANADSALALDIQAVRATAAGNTAAITQERLARITADSVLAGEITSVESALGSKASASAVTALTTRVRDTEAGVSAASDAITQVQARTNRGTASGLLRVAAAGTPTGTQARIGLRAEAAFDDTSHSAALFLEANSDGTSACTVVANRFAIVQHTAATATRSVPFIVQGGAVYMDIAFIRDLEVDTIKIKNGALTQTASSSFGTVSVPPSDLYNSPVWTTLGSVSIVPFSTESRLLIGGVFDLEIGISRWRRVMRIRILLNGVVRDTIELAQEAGPSGTYYAVSDRLVTLISGAASSGTNTLMVQAAASSDHPENGASTQTAKGTFYIQEAKR